MIWWYLSCYISKSSIIEEVLPFTYLNVFRAITFLRMNIMDIYCKCMVVSESSLLSLICLYFREFRLDKAKIANHGKIIRREILVRCQICVFIIASHYDNNIA